MPARRSSALRRAPAFFARQGCRASSPQGCGLGAARTGLYAMALHRPEGPKGKPIAQWRRRRAHTAEAGTPERKAPREETRARQGGRGAGDEPDHGWEELGAEEGASTHTHRRAPVWATETPPGMEAGEPLPAPA